MFTVLILKDWATTLGVGKVFIKGNLPYKLNKSLQIYEVYSISKILQLNSSISYQSLYIILPKCLNLLLSTIFKSSIVFSLSISHLV
jgi:hypothetical protein